MVARNCFEVEASAKRGPGDLIRRAQVADSIHNALAPYGIGQHGWRCTTYNERGDMQELDSRDCTGSQQGDGIASHSTIDGQNPNAIDEAYGSGGNNSSNPFDFSTDDEFPVRHSTRPKIRRGVCRRGRSLLPRDASLFNVAPYPLPAQAVESTSDTDDDPIPQKKQVNIFRIDDTPKVTAFLISRLKRMQQLADKKIAKAWIKGICPKKQAKFPYQNNRKDGPGCEKEKPLLPGWWPDPYTVCQFKEPDHIKRDERMRLCLHLLRLRPSPDQLRIWNQDKSEPHPTHVTVGWTAFLRELAGVEIFEDLPKEDKNRTQQKQDLMMQMYEVAEMEENFQIGGTDGNTTYQWTEDDEERKPPAPKRARQPSLVSTHPARESRASSVSLSRARPKKARRDSLSDASTIVPFKADVEMLDDGVNESQQSQGFIRTEPVRPQNGDQSTIRSDRSNAGLSQPRHQDTQYDSAPMKRDSSMSSHAGDETVQWHVTPGSWTDHTSSFGSSHSGHFHPQCFQTPSGFPGRQDFEFPQFQQQNMVQVRQVNHIQEPQFHTVPNTPVFPQAMPLGSYMPTPCELPQATYSTPMPSRQYFMPATSDPAVAEFHPPMTVGPRPHQQDHHELAERHIAPMQYHGLPQHGEWGQQYYHHHHRA